MGCSTAQRRRTTVGLHRGYCRRFDDEVVWAIPPYFRKPAKKKRSRGRHLVPLVGWAAEAERRLDLRTGDEGWYFQNRKRRVNKRTARSGAGP